METTLRRRKDLKSEKTKERKDKMSTSMRELASALAGIRECEARIADYREKIKREEETCKRLKEFGDKLDVKFVRENTRLERTFGSLLLDAYSVVRALFFASPAGVMIISAGRARWCSTVSEAVNVLRKEKDEVEIWTEVE